MFSLLQIEWRTCSKHNLTNGLLSNHELGKTNKPKTDRKNPFNCDESQTSQKNCRSTVSHKLIDRLPTDYWQLANTKITTLKPVVTLHSWQTANDNRINRPTRSITRVFDLLGNIAKIIFACFFPVLIIDRWRVSLFDHEWRQSRCHGI